MQEDDAPLLQNGWRLYVHAGEWQRGGETLPCFAEQRSPGSPARCGQIADNSSMRTLEAVRTTMRMDAPAPSRQESDDSELYSYLTHVDARCSNTRNIAIARFDVVLRSSILKENILLVDSPRFDIEPLGYKPEDGTWDVAQLVLSALLASSRST